MTDPETQSCSELTDLLDQALADLRAGRTVDLSSWQTRFPEHASRLASLLEAVRALDGAITDWQAAADFVAAAACSPCPAGPLPVQIGRYAILERLGAGGMGTVYRANDPQLDRPVALKVPHFRPAGPDRRLVVERFVREGRAAARVRHPYVCPVYDVGEHEGLPYVVMAYIDGHPLSALLEVGALGAQRAAELVAKVALGLEAVHAAGVIHRDIKPSNILLDASGEPLLTDFGLALPVADAEPLTRDGAVVGTPAFMAPEQAAGRTGAIGPATDIYALGVVLYVALTGRRPFEGPAAPAQPRPGHEPPCPPSALCGGLDPALDAIVLRALAQQPEGRYRSAREFAGALHGWLDTRGGAAVPETPQPARADAPVARVVEAITEQPQTVVVSGLPGGQSVTVAIRGARAEAVSLTVQESGRRSKSGKRRWRLTVAFTLCLLLLGAVGTVAGKAFEFARAQVLLCLGLLGAVVVVAVFYVGSWLYNRDDSEDAVVVVASPRVRAYFEDGGIDKERKESLPAHMRFGVAALGPSKPKEAYTKLTYSLYGRTNSTVVRIDGNDHAFGVRGGHWEKQTDRPDGKGKTPALRGTTKWGGEKTECVWRFNDGIQVTQTVEVVPGEPIETRAGFKRLLDTVLVRYRLENKDDKPHQVGLRFLLDTLIGMKDDGLTPNDGVPFTVPGLSGLLDTCHDFVPPTPVPDFVQVLQKPDLKEPGLIALLNFKVGSGVEVPMRVALTRWPGVSLLWEIPVVPMRDDSAVAIYWNPRELKPGEKREVGFCYGVGGVASDSGQLGLSVGGDFSPGAEFTVVALVSNPKRGETVTLRLPQGLTLRQGEQATRAVPQAQAAGRPTPVAWRVRSSRPGSFSLDVHSSSGDSQSKRVWISNLSY
jgi:hypothetical protein